MHIIVRIPKAQPHSATKQPEPLHKSPGLIELRKYEIAQMIDSWYLVQTAPGYERIRVCLRVCECLRVNVSVRGTEQKGIERQKQIPPSLTYTSFGLVLCGNYVCL